MNWLLFPISLAALVSGCATGISAPQRSSALFDPLTIPDQIVVHHELLDDGSARVAPVVEAIAAVE